MDKEGIANNIVDVKIKRDPFAAMKKSDIDEIQRKIVEEIKSARPLFVGISCYTTEYTTVMPLARLIKENCHTTIIIGGLHATLRPEDFIFEDSPVDFVVIGEGEITLAELLRVSLKGSPLEDVKGIAFMRQDRLVRTQDRERIQDLGLLPRPAYEKLNMEYYLKPTRYLVRLLLLSGLHILTTRGCPHQCTFCANRMKKVTYRPIADVVDELKWLKKNYYIDSFYIADDTFCIRKERVYEFIELLGEIPYNSIWAMETTVKSIDEKMIRQLKKAGCIQIDFGVESGSQEALNRMKKGITVEEIEETFRLCRRYGIRTYANVMFNTPEEREEDVQKTINLMKQIRATNYGINLTVPFVGTEVYEKYVSPKLTKDEYYIYNDPDLLYHSIPDKRFRLAKHNLDLPRLYTKVLLRFTLLRAILDITLNRHYWLTLLRSKRRLDYIIYFIEGLKRQARVFYRYFIRFISKKEIIQQ
ncbi:MAG: B12-binding domain-containing radical SAM protein [Candidatus Omnitrophica bacterium]|nr:B12-binding domain-containing radical SAM protein [Candidatus Omnitrophota bacterium]